MRVTYSSNSGVSSFGNDLCNMLRTLRWRCLFGCIACAAAGCGRDGNVGDGVLFLDEMEGRGRNV
jgi:hypothetical protein